MKAFVTGAAGFIGAALVDRCRTAGLAVAGIDRVVPAGEPTVLAGDTLTPAGWQHALTGVDVVVHTAAVVSNAVDLDEQWRVNVLGTRRVIAAAAAAGVRRFVHLSSVRAFSDLGFPDGVDEEHPVRPDGNPYVDTKIAAEHVVLQAHAAGELEGVVIRPADVYGPGSRPWVEIPLDLMAAGQFVLPAMGRGVFSPVHVDDVVRALLLAATHPSAAGQVFTVTGPRPTSTREYFGALARAAELRRPIVVPTAVAMALAGIADRANRVRGRRSEVNVQTVRYLARTGSYSGTKVRRVLGYEPEVDLDVGMARLRDRLRSGRQ